jgi:hypothetical protein
VPADGVKAANGRENGDFGTSPFSGSSLDKPVLASVWLHGGAEGKAQRGEKLNAEDLRELAQPRLKCRGNFPINTALTFRPCYRHLTRNGTNADAE